MSRRYRCAKCGRPTAPGHPTCKQCRALEMLDKAGKALDKASQTLEEYFDEKLRREPTKRGN